MIGSKGSGVGSVVGTLVGIGEGGGTAGSAGPPTSVPMLSQGVLGKQLMPSGQSALDPLGQGLTQVLAASSKSYPQ